MENRFFAEAQFGVTGLHNMETIANINKYINQNWISNQIKCA